jgi:prepilin-type N-terminal cleavage/methylation domain-containing protein
MRPRGFTLLEVLIAISILVIIVSVIYASFASVTNSMMAARVKTEDMRLRQFLERSFRTNLTAVYVDRAFQDPVYQFIGVDEEGTEGPRDSLRFVSVNTLIGGMALPGDFKEVRYDVIGGLDASLDLHIGYDDPEDNPAFDPTQRKLQTTETPVMASNAQELDSDTGYLDPNAGLGRNEQNFYEAPSWSVPIRTLDITYFDGVEWVDEWDSQLLGKLPWCVRIAVNFARTEDELLAERDEGLDVYENPDLEIVVPLPVGIGRTQDGRSQEQIEEQLDQAEEEQQGGDENEQGSTDSRSSELSPSIRRPATRTSGGLGGRL